MSLENKLAGIVKRHHQLQQTLIDSANMSSQDFAQASKEYADLTPIVAHIHALEEARKQLKDAEALLKEPGLDADMKAMAEEELAELEKEIPALDHAVRIALLPKDEDDERNAILEIRAGTGGDEAALFGGDLLRMYERYAALKGWKFELLSLSEAGKGGCKEASATITGKGVFARLKYESGVHRVQRVPETESGGRVHTSAATVAVLPEVEEVDVHIEEKDLRIDVFRASGPGGQSVNTTDSAVRVTHLPTGLVVSQQDEKSQHKNKAKALKVLRARLYEMERSKRDAERAANRKSQVGSGDRSERIRTYNFPQGRVTDHRINMTLYRIQDVLDGTDLDEFVDALTAEDQANRMQEEV
ncbi:peptide chain release factor 1 [bacterium]|nr:peptide chain release factor 1 [bacterium]